MPWVRSSGARHAVTRLPRDVVSRLIPTPCTARSTSRNHRLLHGRYKRNTATYRTAPSTAPFFSPQRRSTPAPAGRKNSAVSVHTVVDKPAAAVSYPLFTVQSGRAVTVICRQMVVKHESPVNSQNTPDSECLFFSI